MPDEKQQTVEEARAALDDFIYEARGNWNALCESLIAAVERRQCEEDAKEVLAIYDSGAEGAHCGEFANRIAAALRKGGGG